MDRQPIPIGGPAVEIGSGEDPRVTPTKRPSGTGVRGARPRGRGQGQRRVARGDPSPRDRSRVLLLNATFEPLTAVSLRRAVVLVVCGKAEVVHGDASGLLLHSETVAVPVPSVIRLSRYVRVPYRAKVPLTRAGLLHRDGHRCGYCGGKADTIDHVIPKSRGGQHTWDNCVASCAKCNHRKADRLLGELGWSLRIEPTAPRGRYWRLLAHPGDTDPDWRLYLGDAVA